jgi:glycerophosphoryl diester phosphodiesterase
MNRILRPGMMRGAATGERSLDGIVDLQGHRGARGKRPENTIPAFIYCLAHHMTTIELDTNVTKDMQLIVNHDTKVNGKICIDEQAAPARYVPIRDLTVEQLRRLDCGAVTNVEFPEQRPVAGTHLITLPEFFEFVGHYERTHDLPRVVRFNIETKFPDDYSAQDVAAATTLVVAAIESAGMAERSTVQSFVLDVLPEVKRLHRAIKTSALFEPGFLRRFLLRIGLNVGRYVPIARTLAVNADIVSPHVAYVNTEFVRRCHREQLRVLPWIVNEEKAMIQLLDRGVDGIISDYPDRLYRAYTYWTARGEHAHGALPR